MQKTGRCEWLVYDARVNCGQRLIQSIRVHRIDAQTRQRITTIDLQGAAGNQPQAVHPGSNMAEHLRARVC